MLALGAADYITKPLNPDIVEAGVHTHLELKTHRDRLENLVRKRTRDLEETNRQLQAAFSDLENEIVFRKNTENKLRASESKLASIIDAFQGFIYICDRDSFDTDFMNQALIDHVGGNGTGKRCYEVIFGNREPCPWCAVESVSNGLEAVKKIESAKYSLVLADEQIPENGGVAVLSSIKKISPQIPVIIMTANGTVHNAVEAMLAGASDYLLKPFSLEILNKTVKKTLEFPN